MCLPSSLTSKDVPHQLYILALHTYDAENHRHRAQPDLRYVCRLPNRNPYYYSLHGRMQKHGNDAVASTRRRRRDASPSRTGHRPPDKRCSTRTRNSSKLNRSASRVGWGSALCYGARLRRGALHLGRLWRRRPLRRLRRRRADPRKRPWRLSGCHGKEPVARQRLCPESVSQCCSSREVKGIPPRGCLSPRSCPVKNDT